MNKNFKIGGSSMNKLIKAAAAAAVAALMSCSGSDGKNGSSGATGDNCELRDTDGAPTFWCGSDKAGWTNTGVTLTNGADGADGAIGPQGEPGSGCNMVQGEKDGVPGYWLDCSGAGKSDKFGFIPDNGGEGGSGAACTQTDDGRTLTVKCGQEVFSMTLCATNPTGCASKRTFDATKEFCYEISDSPLTADCNGREQIRPLCNGSEYGTTEYCARNLVIEVERKWLAADDFVQVYADVDTSKPFTNNWKVLKQDSVFYFTGTNSSQAKILKASKAGASALTGSKNEGKGAGNEAASVAGTSYGKMHYGQSVAADASKELTLACKNNQLFDLTTEKCVYIVPETGTYNDVAVTFTAGVGKSDDFDAIDYCKTVTAGYNTCTSEASTSTAAGPFARVCLMARDSVHSENLSLAYYNPETVSSCTPHVNGMSKNYDLPNTMVCRTNYSFSSEWDAVSAYLSGHGLGDRFTCVQSVKPTKCPIGAELDSNFANTCRILDAYKAPICPEGYSKDGDKCIVPTNSSMCATTNAKLTQDGSEECEIIDAAKPLITPAGYTANAAEERFEAKLTEANAVCNPGSHFVDGLCQLISKVPYCPAGYVLEELTLGEEDADPVKYCTKTPGPAECKPTETWNPETGRCILGEQSNAPICKNDVGENESSYNPSLRKCIILVGDDNCTVDGTYDADETRLCQFEGAQAACPSTGYFGINAEENSDGVCVVTYIDIGDAICSAKDPALAYGGNGECVLDVTGIECPEAGFEGENNIKPSTELLEYAAYKVKGDYDGERGACAVDIDAAFCRMNIENRDGSDAQVMLFSVISDFTTDDEGVVNGGGVCAIAGDRASFDDIENNYYRPTCDNGSWPSENTGKCEVGNPITLAD